MIRTLLVVVILLGVGHLAYSVASPVLRNRMLQGRLVELSKNRALKSERSIRADVVSFAIDNDIPLSSDDIVVKRYFEETHIATRYSVTVHVWFYEHTYHFYPSSHVEDRLGPEPPRRARALGS